MDNKYALGDLGKLIEYIDLPYTSNDIGFRKPLGNGLIRIEEEFHIDPLELVFVFAEDGRPELYNIVDRDLSRICMKIGIEPISVHTLRHSFATRCIERGMKPKTLQILLGHANIETTMNLYVHVTEETIFEEMKKFEAGRGRLFRQAFKGRLR